MKVCLVELQPPLEIPALRKWARKEKEKKKLPFGLSADPRPRESLLASCGRSQPTTSPGTDIALGSQRIAAGWARARNKTKRSTESVRTPASLRGTLAPALKVPFHRAGLLSSSPYKKDENKRSPAERKRHGRKYKKNMEGGTEKRMQANGKNTCDQLSER